MKRAETLKDVRQVTEPTPLNDALQLLLLRKPYTQAVIEYNGRGWYDLHPLMREALQEMGRLDVLAQ